MRVASFNLLHGRSTVNGRVDADRLAAAVRSLDVDVLGVQEADRDQPRSAGLDLTAVAANALGAQHWRFEPALLGTPGERWRAAGADQPDRHPAYGVGLVSRLPVRSWHVVRLSAAPLRAPVLVPGVRRPLLLDDEPRVGLAAVVETGPDRVMTVATTHLSFVPVWNGVQLRRLVGALRELPQPQLLVGDLNLPGRLPWLLSGWRLLARAKTYPAGEPSVQLDHALGHGPLPAVLGSEARELALSD